MGIEPTTSCLRGNCSTTELQTLMVSQTLRMSDKIALHCIISQCSQSGAPGGDRTPDLLVRSQTLYPLSYGRIIGGVDDGTRTHKPPEPQSGALPLSYVHHGIVLPGVSLPIT